MRDRQGASVECATAPATPIACAGVCVLIAAVPFETTSPLLTWQGQSVSSAEALLFIVLGAWLVSLAQSRRWPEWRTTLTTPWILVLATALVAAAAAPAFRGNAINMSLRLVMAFAVFLLTVNGVSSWRRLRTVMVVAAATGVVLSALLIADFAAWSPVRQGLSAFRSAVTVVGAQVRASGPFQYPTIASMYLEILFALALPLVGLALDRRRPVRAAAAIGAALVIAEAGVLTFTRAGLVTMTAAVAWLALLRVRRDGFDRVAVAYVLIGTTIAALFVGSRSMESVALRLTTEAQEAWYDAWIEAPPQLTVSTGGTTTIELTLENRGRVTWDSRLAQPFRVSYHWLTADGTQVVSWEGRRTLFPAPVSPDEQITLQVDVGAPRQPGDYLVLWDVEQEHRLWFSTEPGAPRFVSKARVTGEALGPNPPLAPLPRPLQSATIRPGRLMLWRAAARISSERPLLGVGPDNYRLHYGTHLHLAEADTRLHSNNLYLEVLTGTGLVGAAAFALLLTRAALSGARTLRRVDALATTVGSRAWLEARALVLGVAAAAAAVVLHGLVDSFLSFTATYVLIAITLGLLVSCEALSQQHAHRV
jgi:hypothetical protein